jgi:hypothetical protein
MKYSEEVRRFAALDEDGKPCEILERVTYGREELADGTLGEASVANRRFDLKTGERVHRLSDDEFENDLTGAKLQLQR